LKIKTTTLPSSQHRDLVPVLWTTTETTNGLVTVHNRSVMIIKQVVLDLILFV
jgi:hypothetical protein